MYQSKNHSKFLLRYNIILVCKYRKYLMLADRIKFYQENKDLDIKIVMVK
ncbi:MAG: hypothetical protein RRZ84_08830 [Romboutsia sp.]